MRVPDNAFGDSNRAFDYCLIDSPRTIRIRALVSLSLFLITLGASILSLPSSATAETRNKRVLVFSAYDLNRPALIPFIQSLRATIVTNSKSHVEFSYELQDENGSSAGKHDDALVSYLTKKYEGETFDLVIALGAPAVRLLQRHESELFTNTPVIFYLHDETEETAQALWPRMTGLWATVDVDNTAELALNLHPDTQNIVVISGSSDEDRFIKQRAQASLKQLESKLQITNLSDVTMSELQARVASLPPHSIIIYLSFFMDRLGNRYATPEALSMMAPSATAPIYGISDTYMGRGIVGGSLIDFDGLGRLTGQLGLRILEGEQISNIRPQTLANVPIFDWRQVKRWQIDERRLPPGAVIRFRTPTFWEQYKWYATAAIAALLLEAILIVWLLVTQHQRKQGEIERRKLSEVAAKGQNRLEEIVSNIPGVVWETVIDPKTNQRQSAYISDYIRTMAGYTPEEWLAAPLGLGTPEEDRERVARDAEAVMATGKGRLSQCRWRTKDGRIIWTESYLSPMVDGSNTVIGLRGITIDVTQRKLTEETLRQTQEKEHAILEAIPDLMFLQSRDGVYLDYHCNNRNSFPFSPGQFIGKSMREVLPRELSDKIADCFQRVIDGGEAQLVEWDLSQNGNRRWFEACIVNSGVNILSVIRDITARRLAEAALKESELNYRSMFNAANDAIFVHELATGAIVDVNERMCEMYGCTVEQARHLTVGDFSSNVTPYTEQEAGELVQKAASGAPQVFEWHAKKLTGELFWVEVSLRPVSISGDACVIAIVRDITERMMAQQALAESEQRFRNLADTAPVMIWISDDQKSCTYLNQQWLDFTGHSMEEQLGCGWIKGIHPDDVDECLKAHEQAFDTREPFRVEYRLRRADGIYRWVFTNGTPRFSAAGEFLGYIGSCVDITDRKESEEALVSAHEELVVAHKEVSRLKNQLAEENIYLQEEIKLQQNFGEIVGASDALKYVLFKIEQVAPTDSTVLITGETGTGKELVARAIHSASLRRERPMVKVSCAALSASLIESELFGHEKGAFTGAIARKIGRFELADGATIFLDEIGELPLESQVKLLRVLQEGEFERLGSAKTVKVDVRIIAATNRNLEEQVNNGSFREDLYYRLNVFPITVPPLRQRREDIPTLVEHFTKINARKIGREITSIAPATMNALSDYSWPGNVRELQNVIERAVINSHQPVLRIHEQFRTPHSDDAASERTRSLEDVERDYIVRVLEDRRWRIEGHQGAAQVLGLNPSTLRTRMAKLGIVKSSQRSAGSN